MKQTANPSDKPLSRPLWWGLFLTATYVMSLWFQTFKAFTVQPTLQNGAVWLGVMLLLSLVLGVLVYDSYVQEKRQGRLHHTLGLFEWLYRRRFLLPPDALSECSPEKGKVA